MSFHFAVTEGIVRHHGKIQAKEVKLIDGGFYVFISSCRKQTVHELEYTVSETVYVRHVFAVGVGGRPVGYENHTVQNFHVSFLSLRIVHVFGYVVKRALQHQQSVFGLFAEIRK